MSLWPGSTSVLALAGPAPGPEFGPPDAGVLAAGVPGAGVPAAGGGVGCATARCNWVGTGRPRTVGASGRVGWTAGEGRGVGVVLGVVLGG
ncbi:MAG: hypothetical protein ACRD2F_13015, partial [Terriglobales bacterium]